MKNPSLFRRTFVEHSEDSEIVRAHYTSPIGIDFEIIMPDEERLQYMSDGYKPDADYKPDKYYLRLLMNSPFVFTDETCLDTDDYNLALHEASVYVYGLFSGIEAVLQIASDKMMRQFTEDGDVLEESW